jgi:H+-transporting ATPase
MIEVAAALSAIVGHWEDFAIILALLVANSVIGFWEEFQAGNTIAALKAKLALTARVKAAGRWTVSPARELVPGDFLRLRIGYVVPADARLLEGDLIEVDQSALTGESLPVSHAPGDSVYSGSVIKQGEIDALVYVTGRDTYFGRTAQLVEKAHTLAISRKPSCRLATI